MVNKIILSSLLFLACSVTTFSQTKNFIDQPYIEVSGSADSLVTPNEIYIRIIISEKDNRDRTAVEEIEAKMITAFKKLGINTEKNLETSDMLSNYHSYIFKSKGILKSKEYVLKVTDATTASKVFIALEDLGISNSSIDRVYHTDLENITNVCRAKAMDNAKTTAENLAKVLGQKVGNAIFIATNENMVPQQLQGRAAGLNLTEQVNAYGAYKYETPKIEFEKIRIRSIIDAKFKLE